MSETKFTVTIDGQALEASPGETVLDVAARAGIEIPTLCEDGRLDSVGACRMCLVDVAGQRRLQPACTWKAEPDQVVDTVNPRVQRHRQLLTAMYVADNPVLAGVAEAPKRPFAQPNEVARYAEKYPAEVTFDAVCSEREGRDDANPYIHFDPDFCIACRRCVRYCDEVEGVNAITMAGRGAKTTVATAAQIGLLDSTCELCGGCIDTCPTGALSEKKPSFLNLDALLEAGEPEVVRSTCNFCGVGCQLNLHVTGDRVVKVSSPPPGETVNDGNLCVKGRFAYDFVHHPDRLTEPMVRGDDGELHPTSWAHAIRVAADGLLGVKKRHGADALGFVSSSRCTGEENYLMQKLARAAFGTNNCHQCAAT